MKSRIMVWLIVIAILLVVDYYVFQAVLTVAGNGTSGWRPVVRYLYWIPTVVAVLAIGYYALGDPYKLSHTTRTYLVTALAGIYISKIFAVMFLFVDDLQRGVKWVARFFQRGSSGDLPGEAITRSEFLAKTALIAAAVPLGTMAYGILSGAHDYRIRRKTIYLPNLPKSFDGIKIAQLSDIHSGSFFNRTAVKGGVEMVLGERPDVILFTGDLVNNETAEVKDYIDIFGKLKAPYGVYSVTGNHDYGDYKDWDTREAKFRNFKDLIEAHKLMGFNLLMNTNDFILSGSDKLAIIGIENWGAGRFAKYGKLADAYKGSEEAPVKLLLSHDPSHWDAQVRPYYPDIDVMFSGHTHGFQFGVELGGFKWSPSQYIYKQWAGLYQEGEQYLYVNRGFGYLGFPGRIGMPPELTLVELKSA